jgi:hypothetical protein
MKYLISQKKGYIIFIAIALFLTIFTRVYFKIGPNIEIVTALSLASGYFFKNKKFSIFVPLILMYFSDLIIGNNNIYLFTWTGFLVAPILGVVASKLKFKKLNTFANAIIISTSSGILSVIEFYLWTNFGVVMMSSMYTKDIVGLLQSYINALPFLSNQLKANIVYIPLVFTAIIAILNINIIRLDKLKYKFIGKN